MRWRRARRPPCEAADHQTASSLLRGRRRLACVLRNLREVLEPAIALLSRSTERLVHPQVERRPCATNTEVNRCRRSDQGGDAASEMEGPLREPGWWSSAV